MGGGPCFYKEVGSGFARCLRGGCVGAALLFVNVNARRFLFLTLVVLLLFNKGGVPRLVGNVNGNMEDFGRNVGRIRSGLGRASRGGRRAASGRGGRGWLP